MSQGGPATSASGAMLRVIVPVLVTIGAVLVLFVAYELWWTNVVADHSADQVAEGLRQGWGTPHRPTRDRTRRHRPRFGGGVRLMYVPTVTAHHDPLMPLPRYAAGYGSLCLQGDDD